MYKKVVSSIILIIMLLQLLANSCFAVVVESNEQINSISQNEVENALSESSTNTENGKENINDIGEIKQDDNVSKIEENEQDKNTNVTVNDNEKNQNTEEKEETKQEENKKIDIEDQYITEDDLLYSNKYLVKNGVVSRIDPNTTIEEFKKQVQIAKGNELTFYKKDGVTPLEGKILGTGMIVKGTNGQNYTLSVKGDVTGEGEANQVELTMMIRHAIELQGWELKNLDLTSADINGNGTVDIVDIDKMIKHIVFGKWEYDNTVTPNPPTIEVIGTEGSEEDLYTSEIEIKIKEDKSTKNSKTTYKISGAKEKEETSIEENETIKINEDGEYLITAYTYGVQGNRSKASNRKITVKKVETPKPEIYNINYELNGGENNSENPLTYTYGEEVELKDATKDCYTFKGWYKEQELTNKVSKIEKTQKGDITVYAKWEANKYNINYELNGGKNNSENPLTYTYGEEVELKDATKDCYTFKGWYKEQELTNKVSKIEKTQKGDITVYAKWEANKYNINYELNGGKNNSENPITYTYGEEVELKDATRVGYTFKGWYKEQELTNEVSKIEKTQKGDITVYAKWLKNEYKLIVHHYAKGTTNKLAEDEIFVGEEIGQEYQTKSLIPTLDEQGNIIETDGREYLNPSKYYVDGIEGNEQGTYIDGTIEVTYYYSVKSFKITGEAGEGGKIENADETVKYGENSTKQIIITPDQNKKVKNVTVNGRALINYEEDEETLVVTLPIFENVTEDKKIEATFEDLVMVAEIVSAPEGYESLIGTRYTSIEKAVKASPSVATIKVIADTENEPTATIDKDITLDLNGKTVKGNNKIIVVKNNLNIINNVGQVATILSEEQEAVEVVSGGNFTLGKNDNYVNCENLIIEGKQNGVVNNGIFNFYDGQIKGIVAINGKVNDTPYLNNTIVTNVGEKQKATLSVMEDAEAAIGNKPFSLLEDAINYANVQIGEDNSQVKITVLKDLIKNNYITIEEEKNILLDLNNCTITIKTNKSNAITNRGTLEITDNSEEKMGTIVSTNSLSTVSNSKNLKITGGKIVSDLAGIRMYGGTFELAGGNIEVVRENASFDEYYYGVYNPRGTVKITSGTIVADTVNTSTNTGYGIYNEEDGELQIDGGEISASCNAVMNEGKCTVNGGIIYKNPKNKYNRTFNNTGTTIMNGGRISAQKIEAESVLNTGNFTINNGETYGIYNVTGGKLVVNGGSLNNSDIFSKQYAIYNEESGKENEKSIIEINGGNLEKVYSEGQATITGGTFKYIYNGKRTTYLSDGNGSKEVTIEGIMKITGGNVNTTGSMGIQNVGQMSIKNFSVIINNSTDYDVEAVYNVGQLNIENTTISAIQRYYKAGYAKTIGIYNMGNIIINGMTLNVSVYSSYSNDAYGIRNSGSNTNLKILSGKISATSRTSYSGYEGTPYGIYNENNAIIELGNKDGIVNNDIINISTSENGIYNRGGKFRFYDGTLKGKVAISGEIDDIEENSQIKTVEEYSMQTSTLEKDIKIAKIGDVEYSTIKEAIQNCPDSEKTTIQLIYKDIYEVSEEGIIIPENKDIVLDMNGNNIFCNKKIDNKGTFEIMDSSSGGKCFAEVINSGNLKLGNIILYKDQAYRGNYKILENNGTLDVQGVNLYGYIVNNENATVNMNDGIIKAITYGIHNIGNLNVTGGTIKAESNNIAGNDYYGVYNQNGNINITGGIIEAKHSVYNNAGKVTIKDGTLKTSKYGIYNTNAGTVEMNGGSIKNSTYPDEEIYGIYNEKNGVVKLENGEISLTSIKTIVKYAYGIYTAVTAKTDIIGGTVNVDGTKNNAYGVYNLGTTVLGKKGEGVNKENPSIIGYNYATYNSKTGTIKFFDGVIKSPNNLIYGSITQIEESSEMITSTDEKNRKQAYLDLIPLLQIEDTQYYTLEEALESISVNNEQPVTMKLLRNVNYLSTSERKVIQNRNVILDLNGYTISTQLSDIITNKGKLKITDQSSSKTGKITNTISGTYSNYINIIKNQGTLEIDGIEIKGEGYTYNIYNENGATATIKNTNIDAIKNIGTVNMVGGKANSIINDGQLTLENGECKNIQNNENSTANIIEIIIKNDTEINNYGNLNLNRTKREEDSNKVLNVYNRKAAEVVAENVYINTITNYGKFKLLSGQCININNEKDYNSRGKIEIIRGIAYNINNMADLTLGEKDGTVNVETPIIQNYFENKGIFNFYDGTIIGNSGLYDVIHGNVADVEEGYGIVKEKIDQSMSKVYLTKQAEAIIGEQEYNTLTEAINAVSLQNSEPVTIKVNRNIRYLSNETSKIIENKNIILDLNGYQIITQISNFIQNKGTLKIIDSSQEKTGEILSPILNQGENIIKNEGTLTLLDVKLKVLDYYYNTSNNIIENEGTLIIDGKTLLYSEKIGIYNSTSGNLTINSIEADGEEKFVENYGTFTLNGGKFNENIDTVIENKGKFVMEGGEFSDHLDYGLKNYNDAKINGGTLCAWYNVIYNYQGTTQIYKNAIISIAKNSWESAVVNESNFNIYGGKIKGKIENSKSIVMGRGIVEGYINNAEGSKVWIYGGEITNNSGEAIENRGSLTIGINDVKGQVNVSTPIICGSTYGIYNYTSTASIGFYDGIIKGKTRPMNNTPKYIPSKYEIVYSNGNTTATLRLKGRTTKIASIEGVYFESSQLAVNSAKTGDIVKIETSDEFVDTIVVPEGVELTIDLNGYNLLAIGDNPAIQNNGTLRIVNNGSTTANVQATFTTAIQNNGTLILGVDDGNVQNNINVIGKGKAVDGNGQVTIYDGQVVVN